MEKLNVSCSPGAFGRVVGDLKYRKELSDQMLAEHQNYNGIVFSQTVEEQPKYYEDIATDIVETASAAQYAETIFTPLGNINDGKQYWCEGAVKFMLTSIEELLPKVGKSIAVKTRAKMYNIVSERMAGENYPFSPM